MSNIVELTVYKHLEIPETTLCNVIVDGLLSCNYSLPKAQNIAEDILAGNMFIDERKNLCINKKLILNAINRFCSRNTDIEIEMFSDSANEVFNILIDNYKSAVI